MSKNQKISTLLITLNEEKNLKKLLPELSFSDEIIIVDSCSTDNSKAIAQSFDNVRFFEKEFKDFSDQRNFALEQSKNDWVLFIDADEWLTPELKAEIIQVVNSDSKIVAYQMYRKFYFEEKPLNFSGWQTDKIYRLFKKSSAFYIPKKLVHEKLEVQGTTGILKHKLIHFSYADYNSYKQKMLSYGKLKALEKFNSGFKPTFFHKYFHWIYNFLYNYLLRLGFLDGTKGIIICYLNALSVKERYQELERLNEKQLI